MLSLVLKFLLAVLQALPQLLEAIQLQREKQQQDKRNAEIEKDPLTQFEHKFGQLQSDTESYPDPGSEDLHNSEAKRDPTNTPHSR